ncbi:MAG TPA: hypothetical protein VK074_01810 [Fodinibius sp.]|nr:hypothetical protein [Fodinibius sp.]
MKSTKVNLYKLLAVAMLPIFLGGCLNGLFDDGKITYDGPTQLEFVPLSQTVTIGAGETGSTSVNVQLIGEQRGQDLPVSFVVADTADQHTAVEGVHYTLSTTSVTIAANSSSASFEINLIGDNLEAGDSVQLVLDLQGNSDQNIEAAEELKRYVLTIQGGG